MVNTSKIKGLIVEKGLTQGKVAKAIGITEKSMSSKLTGKAEFKLREMERLIEVLSIDNPSEIFFATKVS